MCDVTGERADRLDALNRLKLFLAPLQIACGMQALDLARDAAGEEIEEPDLVRILAEIATRDDDHRADNFISRSDERNRDVGGRIN